MLVGIHQLHYLPWLRYIEKIARCDVFIVLDNIQFNKNGWQNRNKIKSDQGECLLTVPVRGKAEQRLDEVEIPAGNPWAKKHWRTIEQHYRNAPYFDRFAEFLESTYSTPWTKLNDVNRHMLEFYIDTLGIDTRVVYASDLNAPGIATERLINLIRAVDGTRYYSGAFALDAYLDAGMMSEAGIELELQEWVAPTYPQQYGGFVKDLATVDLLMNCGERSMDILMKAPHDQA